MADDEVVLLEDKFLTALLTMKESSLLIMFLAEAIRS